MAAASLPVLLKPITETSASALNFDNLSNIFIMPTVSKATPGPFSTAPMPLKSPSAIFLPTPSESPDPSSNWFIPFNESPIAGARVSFPTLAPALTKLFIVLMSSELIVWLSCLFLMSASLVA